MSNKIVEADFGKKIDRCLTDTVVKGAGGLVLGGVIGLLLFRRKRWPIICGGGFGIGVAYRSCEHDLNS